jgi:hypothetical protein
MTIHERIQTHAYLGHANDPQANTIKGVAIALTHYDIQVSKVSMQVSTLSATHLQVTPTHTYKHKTETHARTHTHLRQATHKLGCSKHAEPLSSLIPCRGQGR